MLGVHIKTTRLFIITFHEEEVPVRHLRDPKTYAKTQPGSLLFKVVFRSLIWVSDLGLLYVIKVMMTTMVSTGRLFVVYRKGK